MKVYARHQTNRRRLYLWLAIFLIFLVSLFTAATVGAVGYIVASELATEENL